MKEVRGEGFEPSTNWLKANCSTTELPALLWGGSSYTFRAVVQALIASLAKFLIRLRHLIFSLNEMKSLV